MRKSARASLRCGGLCGPGARLHPSCWRKKPDRAEAPGPHERVLQRLFSRNNRGQAALSLRSFMLFIVFFSPSGLVFGGISCQPCLFHRCVCVYLQFISSCECQVRRSGAAGVCVVLWDGDSWRVNLRFPGESKFIWKWITHVVIHYQ